MTTIESTILNDYKSKAVLLNEFKDKVETILNELLKENEIIVHQVPARVKTLVSLARKLDTKKGKYNSFADLTDIVGLRVIVYLENEVDIVAEMVRSEFIIDEKNSVDKRKLSSNSFGYRSLHYVVSLNKQRIALTENKKFKDLKAEIQIRSILQHAWAEIEHDIGYKGEYEIPEKQKRSFSRIAALLETADLEFVKLKEELNLYEKEVGRQIILAPDSVPIDKASLTSYINTSETVKMMDSDITKIIKAKIKGNNLTHLFLIKLPYFKLSSIKELDELLIQNKEGVLKFATLYLKDSNYKTFNRGISLFYLLYYLSAKTESVKEVLEYMSFGGMIIVGGMNAAKLIIERYKLSR